MSLNDVLCGPQITMDREGQEARTSYSDTVQNECNNNRLPHRQPQQPLRPCPPTYLMKPIGIVKIVEMVRSLIQLSIFLNPS